jgi:L-asparagine transporter-like permease
MSNSLAQRPAGRHLLRAGRLEFMAIGSALGSGLFVGSGQALQSAGPSLLLAYAACAGITYIVARRLAEMALAEPGAKSFVHHIGARLGRGAGHVSGWGFWCTTLLIGMAELTAAGLLLHSLASDVPQWLGTVSVARLGAGEGWPQFLAKASSNGVPTSAVLVSAGCRCCTWMRWGKHCRHGVGPRATDDTRRTKASNCSVRVRLRSTRRAHTTPRSRD